MDMDPATGIGRSIIFALDDFARQTGHREISSSKLIVLGFSGTGVLFANFVKYTPHRVMAAILTNPGQTDPYGIKDLDLSADALVVPQFIIVGGIDDRGGTQRPYDYFRRHRVQGAPWVFLIQNGIPHCCVINAKALILEWLDAMMKSRRPDSDRPLRTMDENKGWQGFIRPCDSVRRDHWGEPLWNICDALVQSVDLPSPTDQLPAGWFPTHKIALDWLAFVQQKEHPENSFPDGRDPAHSQFAVH
jgi:hypothetical protein